MKITKNQKCTNSAFTLIEMIGVLAVIAILAALLIPKIFEAINSARVNNCVVSYNTVKTAVMDHYGKYGSLNSYFGTNDMTTPQLNSYDNTLLSEGLLDKPFTVKLGTNAFVQAVVPGSSGGGGGTAGYSLTTNSSINDVVGASYVVEAVVQGVALQDAYDVSSRLDGALLSSGSVTNSDSIGRIKYTVSGSSPTTLYMYITHR